MITAVLITAIAVSLAWGYLLHGMTLQRNVRTEALRQMDEASRTDALRIRILREDRDELIAVVHRAADALTLEVARSARLEIELAGSRRALAVQIAGPEDRMSLLGSNVVALRGAR